MTLQQIRTRLRKFGDQDRAGILQRLFKTGPKEYGESDLFLAIRVLELRKLVKEYQGDSLKVVQELLKSSFYEERLLSLLILVRDFARGDEAVREEIFRLYLKNTRFINNWDLVDVSAEHVVGSFLVGRSRRPLCIDCPAHPSCGNSESVSCPRFISSSVMSSRIRSSLLKC